MSSSSSFSPTAPAFSSQSWKYDVFLSFRGEDTRKTFVDHLFSALEKQGIYTYKDEETLPRGEAIGPSLMKAIEESQIAVIIFSENYADSSWCLDELACIMKCRDTKGQIIMPVFYGVEPSEVRKQKRKYGQAFYKHELENKAKVESWRKALVDASIISGWEPKHIASGHESKVVKKIVDAISQRLQLRTSSKNENLIRIATRMLGLKSVLEIGSGGVRMIGIWGMGGGGKTTLASSIYAEICRQFDGSCFVENVREESGRYGLGKLKEDILSKIGVNKDGGRGMIKDRLCRRKVLIVLDDVDHLDQLKALAGSHIWFGEGSRVIITTRDKHILIAHKVNMIHNVRLLNGDEAMKLFCKHAPRDRRPLEDYEHLSEEVVSYAGGLPLALTVLGSFLCDKDIDEWKSALVRLKETPDTDIVEKLKISFDGLKPVEKELFLEIACFFRRKSKELAMEILEDCGFHLLIGVKVLIQKALITIDNGRFDMHDLVQEMGHQIVRGEHPNNPEKDSRVWKVEDVIKICSMDATTELDMIEAIRFKYNSEGQLQWYKGQKGFKNFIRGQRKSLDSWLIVDLIVILLIDLGLSRPIVANTKNLRWIEWQGDFASHLLSNFPQRTLCHLVLYGSLQKQLWEGNKLLPNLKTIELWGLCNLIMTPNFDILPNLEKLRLDSSRCLEQIHPSIAHVEKLVLLSVNNCPILDMFPSITQLKKLEKLSFSGCHELFKNMDNLPRLELDNIVVTCWRCNRNNLLGVECCVGLRFFLKDLRYLNLSRCCLGDEEIGSAVLELPNLQELDLRENKFSRLSFGLLRLPRLKWLNVSSCQGLVGLSELPSSIAVVKADWCPSLESFGDITNCKWLWNISHRQGKKLRDVDKLLESLLKGNAIEDYFIRVILQHHRSLKGFMGRLFRGSTCTRHLPHEWYNEFCGFLICVVTHKTPRYINIVIKQEVNEDSLLEVWQESNEGVEAEYDGARTYVVYVSFGSLRDTKFLNSSDTMISVSLDCMYGNPFEQKSFIGAELICQKSKGHQPQTTKVATDSSEFWDKEPDYIQPPFIIQHDSKSSINIIWRLENSLH